MLEECKRRIQDKGTKITQTTKWEYPLSKWLAEDIAKWLRCNAIDSTAEKSELERRVKRLAAELSGGQQHSVDDCIAPGHPAQMEEMRSDVATDRQCHSLIENSHSERAGKQVSVEPVTETDSE